MFLHCTLQLSFVFVFPVCCYFVVVVDVYEYMGHHQVSAAAYANSLSPLSPSATSVFAINQLSSPVECDTQLLQKYLSHPKEWYFAHSNTFDNLPAEKETIGASIKRTAAKKSAKQVKKEYDSQESNSSEPDDIRSELGVLACRKCKKLFASDTLMDAVERYKCFKCPNFFHRGCLTASAQAQLDDGETWMNIEYECPYC